MDTCVKTDIVGDRHSLVLIGMAAVWLACLIFAVQRLALTLSSGKLTPWWGNAAGLVGITGLYFWYRRNPSARSSVAAHAVALIATLALLVPIAYGMTSTIWWLSLVGFAMVLLGRRQEAKVWGMVIPMLVLVSVVLEPHIQIQGAAGELPVEAALAKAIFVVILIGMSAGFRNVAERRAIALYDSEKNLEAANAELERHRKHLEELVRERIAEVQRALEEKAKLQDQLQQAMKMESIGRLAGGVAHDFNNMLGVIIGHSEMAMDNMETSQPLYENLSEILKSANRSAALTQQLLAFARRQTVAPVVLDLNDTIAGIIMMLRRLIGENINLTWNPGPKLHTVKIDPSQVDQILTNLAVNSRDSIDGVGNVTISTENVIISQADCVDNPDFIPGQYVMINVSDSGSGMDKETLTHLFEPFYTNKEVGKGTGLGLSTVYGIVKQNHGFIHVDSKLNLGTTFKLYLPAFTETINSKTKDISHGNLEGTETVLVVEDEKSILKLIKSILHRYGYTVLSAMLPGEALLLAQNHREKIHLLITDVIMPEMNGKELMSNLLNLYPDIKTLFMSGYTANAIAHQGVLDEGVNFIQKPFSTRPLIEKVREVLDSDE